MISQRPSGTRPKIDSKILRSGPLVLSEPINSVDSMAITAIPRSTGSQALIQKRAPRALFDMIVRRLAGDDHVMHMALAEPCAGDADELCVFLQLLDGFAAEVSHAGAQAADELVDHRFERPAIRDAAFDALGNELGKAVLAGTLALHHALASQLRAGHIFGALEVAFSGALAHGG